MFLFFTFLKRYLRDYMMWLRLSDGAARVKWISAMNWKTPFLDRCVVERFKSFSVAHHTLSWDNRADFAPEFLRERVAVTV